MVCTTGFEPVGPRSIRGPAGFFEKGSIGHGEFYPSLGKRSCLKDRWVIVLPSGTLTPCRLPSGR